MKQKYLLLVLLIALLPQMANAQWFWESAEDLYEQGMKYYKAKDYNNAYTYLSKAGEKGDARAYNRIGIMYLDGIGVSQNDNKAYESFVKGYNTNSNNKASNYWIGYCYYTGCGVNQNYNNAYKYFKIAADKGNALANRSLGLMYYSGDGLPKNYSYAVSYFNYAANEGDPVSKTFLGLCYLLGRGVPMDPKLGQRYLESAASQGNKLAKEILEVYNSHRETNWLELINKAIPWIETGWKIIKIFSK